MSFFPVANYTKPFWLSEEDFIGTYRSTEEIPASQDILIIGSGYAGTSMAYFLSKENPDLKISMFEARNICSGATGRNGGHLKPFYHNQHDWVLNEYGLEEAAKNVEYEFRHIGEIKRLIEEEEIDCDFHLTRLCDFYPTELAFAKYDQEIKNFKKNPHVSQFIKDLHQVHDGETARTISGNDNTTHCVTAPAASLWPWKLITGILKKLIKLPNFNLQANTLVQDFTKLDDGEWLVKTNRGDTKAKRIVFATNAYTKALLSEFSDAIIPRKGTVTHIAQKGEAPQHLNFSSGFFFEDGSLDYLINRPDGSIVIGGGENTFYEKPSDKDEKFNNVDDSYNLEATEKYLDNYAQKLFATWKNVPTVNDYTWSGILSVTNDEFPYVGDLDQLNYDNCHIIAGFSGHGMPRILLSAKALAKSIVTGEPLDDIPEAYKLSKTRLERKFLESPRLKVKLYKD